jgi:hypothetical protein
MRRSATRRRGNRTPVPRISPASSRLNSYSKLTPPPLPWSQLPKPAAASMSSAEVRRSWRLHRQRASVDVRRQPAADGGSAVRCCRLVRLVPSASGPGSCQRLVFRRCRQRRGWTGPRPGGRACDRPGSSRTIYGTPGFGDRRIRGVRGGGPCSCTIRSHVLPGVLGFDAVAQPVGAARGAGLDGQCSGQVLNVSGLGGVSFGRVGIGRSNGAAVLDPAPAMEGHQQVSNLNTDDERFLSRAIEIFRKALENEGKTPSAPSWSSSRTSSEKAPAAASRCVTPPPTPRSWRYAMPDSKSAGTCSRTA